MHVYTLKDDWSQEQALVSAGHRVRCVPSWSQLAAAVQAVAEGARCGGAACLMS